MHDGVRRNTYWDCFITLVKCRDATGTLTSLCVGRIVQLIVKCNCQVSYFSESTFWFVQLCLGEMVSDNMDGFCCAHQLLFETSMPVFDLHFSWMQAVMLKYSLSKSENENNRIYFYFKEEGVLVIAMYIILSIFLSSFL